MNEGFAAVAQPGWSAALVRRENGTFYGTSMEPVFYNSPTQPVVFNKTLNSFVNLDLEKEIQEFLNWTKTRVSLKTYDNIKRYSRYIYYLAIPTSLLTALENSGLGPWGRHHVMKVLANFVKFLDAKYTTDIFSLAWKKIRRALGLKWYVQQTPPSLIERIEDPEQTLVKIINNIPSRKHKLFAALLAVTGLRTEEAHFLWENYEKKVKEIDGMIVAELMLLRRTKNAYFAFIHPRIHRKIMGRPGYWKRIDLKKFRLSWKKSCEKIGVDHRKWNPYSLRKLHATLLLREMSESNVDLLQGRAPKTVLAVHYNIESLKQLWKAYMKAINAFVEKLDL